MHKLGIWLLQKLVPMFLNKKKMPYGIYDIIIFPRSEEMGSNSGKLYIEMFTTIIQARDDGTPKETILKLYDAAKEKGIELGVSAEFILDAVNEIYDNKDSYYTHHMELYK